MRRTILAVAALVAGTAAESCISGLYMVVARGTKEPEGAGMTGSVTESIARKVPGSQVVPLRYPASLSNPDYQDSVADGVRQMQTTIRDYVKVCPRSKVAVFGYSQGAHVAMDALCGSSGMAGFGNSTPIGIDLMTKNIVAVVLFGDPSHVVNVTYDRGTSVRNGIFNRTSSSVQACNAFADRIVSYCDEGDYYCDRGRKRTVHSLYMSRYGAEVRRFVVDRFKNATDEQGGAKKHLSSTSRMAAMPTSTAPPSTSNGGGPGGEGGADRAGQARGSTSSAASDYRNSRP
ncbi:hypothetical protein XA68_15164 [Ophiocordyceps unilateralis]|uniref:Cutinase n=1 Tax=Ophiocordyceps unilateralis TaxID=268505 RepID=A0A2A9P929_OPHUN|nr:hypothetical protein XA68_15164 [Ophiocordyceps unilateralis]